MIKYIASDDDTDEEQIYCLKHAIKYLNDNRLQPKRCRLAYNYSIEEIKTLIKQINDKLAGREQLAGKRKSGAKAGQASGSK
jgi:protein Jumonji